MCSLANGWTGEAEDGGARVREVSVVGILGGKNGKNQKTKKSDKRGKRHRSHPEERPPILLSITFQLNTGKIPFTATQASKE
mmetsp:Transcript_22087/g.37776  ORF Transcript_22087/g.37776 Transcript_22087/m.37776 type:complete len:82 (-) Transcript_22087:322-567(-)